MMLTYSAKKNNANLRDEYSVWKPPTSSPSASAKSNGARFVSPTIDIAKITKDGNRTTAYHVFDWAATISDVDIEPA